MLQYAAEQSCNNVELYVDNGTSGDSTNRTAFKEMEADISDGKIGAVLVRSICRINRNVAIVEWIDGLKRERVTVNEADGYCDDNPRPVSGLIRSLNAGYTLSAT